MNYQTIFMHINSAKGYDKNFIGIYIDMDVHKNQLRKKYVNTTDINTE